MHNANWYAVIHFVRLNICFMQTGFGMVNYEQKRPRGFITYNLFLPLFLEETKRPLSLEMGQALAL